MPKIKNIALRPVENGFKVDYDVYGKLDPSDPFSPEKFLATKEEVFGGEDAPLEAIHRVIELKELAMGIVRREEHHAYGQVKNSGGESSGIDESGVLSKTAKDQ